MCAKVFMKDPWEKTEYVPRRLRAFVDLVRPFTLLAPAIGGFSGAMIAMISEGNVGWPSISVAYPFFSWNDLPFYKLISGIAALIFLNAASNAFNQVYDRKIDAINKPYRPIPAGIVSSREGLWIAIFLYAFTLWRAALVNRHFLIIVGILILITIAYSAPPLRFKKRLWLSNISIAVPRGMLGFVAAWSIVGDITDPTPWLIGSIMATFLIGSTTTKDFTDMEGDARFGMRTLPIVYGKKKSIILSSPFFVIPFILMTVYWYMDLLPSHAIVMSVVFFLWAGVIIWLLYKEGDKEDAHFENSPAWKQMYLMLMGFQIGFLLIFIL